MTPRSTEALESVVDPAEARESVMHVDDLIESLRKNARHLRSGGARLPPEGKQFDFWFDEAASQLEAMQQRAQKAEYAVRQALDVLGAKN